jgi:NADH:ubiquinone oxidoreductase subunit E
MASSGSLTQRGRSGAAKVCHADPASGAETADDRDAITRLIQLQGDDPTALIEVLHQLQQVDGYLATRSLHQVARQLRLPLSRVYGVASFYHLFRRTPPPVHCCAVCLGTACFVHGALELVAVLELHLTEQARADGWVLERMGCLGACGSGPVLRLDRGLAIRVRLAPAANLNAQLEAIGLPPLGRATAR